MKNSGILLIVGCLILSALHLQAAGPLAEPGAGVLTNATVQITAQDTVPAGGSVALKKIHPALLEAWREYQRQPPQSDVLRARSHLIPRPGGRLLVNIKAMVTDSVLTKIQQSGGLIENAFPKSETIRAEIPVASLETIADLTGVTDIQPAFFTDSEESATNGVHSAFGPAVNGVRPASGHPDSTNTDHLK